MRTELIAAVARLASLDYQRRYVVGGTVDEYVIPEELLEDADGLIRQSRRPEYASQFDAGQTAALTALADAIAADSGAALGFGGSDEALADIEASPVWSQLRAKAAAVLSAFDTDAATVLADEFAAAADT